MQPLGDIVGESPGLAAVRETITRLLHRPSESRRLPPILLQGETGTGKGLVARTIHRAGPRAEGPFVDVNCAAIPETLLEAEMFGFERGAFTDARQAKRGLFQAAHRGTIFLDEVGLLPESLQSKLLKVIEEQQVRRLGSTRSEPVDVWILAATSENLASAARERRFREDLYHRLAVLTLWLPPLRERGGDVLLLAERFLARACADYGLPARTLADSARAALLAYPWPGNVRELINVMERVALLGEEREVTAAALGLAPPARPAAPVAAAATVPLDDAVGEVERAHLLDALRQTGWNISRAAARLGIPRNTLRYRIEKHGLHPEGKPAPRPRVATPAARPPAVSPAGAPPVAAIPAVAPPATVRWERRRVALLRAVLLPVRGADADIDRSRPLALVVEKVQTFGGRVVELGQSGLVAAFGLDPVEDAATRAAHAALSVLTAAARGWEGTGAAFAVAGAIHAEPFSLGRLGAHVEIDQDAKRPAWAVLDALLERAEPGSVLVGPAAAPLLERRFELSPVTLAGPPGRAYRLQKLERPGFGRRMARFVGRQQELDLLKSLFASAARGQGQVAGIVGDAGIGKSRLLFEFRQSLADQPVTYLEGHCVSYGTTIPYLPVLELLRANCAIGDLDSPDAIREKVRAALGDLGMEPDERAPYLLHLLGVKDGTEELETVPAETINARTFDTLRQMSLRGSRRRPVILVVEDLHWVDRTSEAYLASLVEGFAGSRILVVATYRPGYRPPWMEKSYATQVAVRPLSPEDSLAVVRSSLAVPEPMAQRIVAKAQGNPFFLQELALAVGDRPPDAELAVPDTVQELLLARVDRLADDLRAVLENAAVLGAEVPPRLLAGIADDHADQTAALRELGVREFVYEQSGPDEPIYAFKHTLVQEVVYGAIVPDRRRHLHARTVEAMEALYADRLGEHVERLAYHAVQGERWESAASYLRQAAAKASARTAHQEAVALGEQALDALGRLPASRERDEQAVDVRFELRNSLMALGRQRQVYERLEEAERIAERLSDRRRLGWVALYTAVHLWNHGEHDRALEAGLRALAAATELGDPRLRIVATLSLGMTHHSLGEYGRAMEYLRTAIAAIGEDRVRERFGVAGFPAVIARTWLTWCLAELGEFEEGLAWGEEAMRIAEAVDDPWSRASACFGVGYLRMRRGELTEASAVLDRGLRPCRELSIRAWLPPLASVLGYARSLAGEVAEGLPLLREAVEQAASIGLVSRQPVRLAWLCEALLLAGRVEDAAEVARPLEAMRDHKERGHVAWVLRLLGQVARSRVPPDTGAAEADFQEAIGLARRLSMRPLEAHCRLDLGVLYAGARRLEEGRRELTEAVRLFRALGMGGWADRAAAALEKLAPAAARVPGPAPLTPPPGGA